MTSEFARETVPPCDGVGYSVVASSSLSREPWLVRGGAPSLAIDADEPVLQKDDESRPRPPPAPPCAAPTPLPSPPREDPVVDFIVLGAGVAGLAAAEELARRAPGLLGRSGGTDLPTPLVPTARRRAVTIAVVEASERVGGRVLTLHHDRATTEDPGGAASVSIDGTPRARTWELGAAWLHGLHGNVARPYLARSGGRLRRTRVDNRVIYERSDRFDRAAARVPRVRVREAAACFARQDRALTRLAALLRAKQADVPLSVGIAHTTRAAVRPLPAGLEGAPTPADGFPPTPGAAAAALAARAKEAALSAEIEARRVADAPPEDVPPAAATNSRAAADLAREREQACAARALDEATADRTHARCVRWLWAQEQTDIGGALDEAGLRAWCAAPWECERGGEALVLRGFDRLPAALLDGAHRAASAAGGRLVLRLGVEARAVAEMRMPAAEPAVRPEWEGSRNRAAHATPRATTASRAALPPMRVTLADGGALVARLGVVVALPLARARDALTYSPPLPSLARDALDALAVGQLERILIEFDECFWEEDVDYIGFIDDNDDRPALAPWPVNPGAPRAPPPPFAPRAFAVVSSQCDGAPTLLVEAAGDQARALASLSHADAIAACVAALREIYGDDVPAAGPRASAVTRWGANRLAGGGAFVRLPPGARAARRACGAVARERRACGGGVRFAGEHCSARHPGTVHGALLSGRRAATALLRRAVATSHAPRASAPSKAKRLRPVGLARVRRAGRAAPPARAARSEGLDVPEAGAPARVPTNASRSDGAWIENASLDPLMPGMWLKVRPLEPPSKTPHPV